MSRIIEIKGGSIIIDLALIHEMWLRLLYAEKCPNCHKRGFLHSQSAYNRNDKIRAILWGIPPKDGHCCYCKTQFNPVTRRRDDWGYNLVRWEQKS